MWTISPSPVDHLAPFCISVPHLPLSPNFPSIPWPKGRLDSKMATVTRRVQTLLSKLPQDISPANLEELRRVKGALVELEQKADTLRWVEGSKIKKDVLRGGEGLTCSASGGGVQL